MTEENAAKRAPRTVRCEIPRHHAGSTAPVGDDTLEKVVASVLPFVRAAEEAKQEVNGSALTLYQYASLLVELRAGGERASVLARYQVEGEPGLERLGGLLGRADGEEAGAPEGDRGGDGDLGQTTAELARWAGWVMGGSAGCGAHAHQHMQRQPLACQ